FRLDAVVTGQGTTVQVREELTIQGLRTGRSWWIAGVLAAMIVAAWVVWWYARPALPAPVAGKRQIAVFRFENRSGRPDLNWLSDGLPDMLTTTLSRSPELDVLSRDQLYVWLGR